MVLIGNIRMNLMVIYLFYQPISLEISVFGQVFTDKSQIQRLILNQIWNDNQANFKTATANSN